MLRDSLPHFESQIEAGEAGITLLEDFHNADGVQVVFKAGAETLHLAIESPLAGVRKRRMSDVVRQGQGFGQIFIQRQRRGYRTRDLGYFDGVRQAIAKMVAQARREDLGFGFQAAEGARVNNAVAVALESVTVGVRGFRITPPPAGFNRKAEVAEHEGVLL